MSVVLRAYVFQQVFVKLLQLFSSTFQDYVVRWKHLESCVEYSVTSGGVFTISQNCHVN